MDMPGVHNEGCGSGVPEEPPPHLARRVASVKRKPMASV
jgi:hypothetical protein